MKRGYLLALVAMICAATSAATFGADEVVIENRGKRTFYYAVRARDGEAWSKTHGIAPGEKQTHVTSTRLRISYLSDDAQFAWLDANKVYRIDDVTQGRLEAVTEVRRPTLPDVAPSADGAMPAPRAAAELPARATETAEPAPAATDPDATADAPSEPHGATPTAPSASTAAPAANGREDDAFDGIFDIFNRVVTVRAIADNTYRSTFPEWRERARRVVEAASEYYRREYSIRLVLTETREWEYAGVAADLETRWKRLLEESPHDVDLIIAMVGYGEYSSVEGEATLTGQLGRAAFFGQHLMVADRQDYHENRAKTILIHELGHIFGDFHVANQNLMMYPGYLQLPTEEIIAGTVPFGEAIDAVFAMSKEFVFRDGVTSLSPTVQRRIQSLYRQHGLANESRQTDPITSGYEYLEQRAKIVAAQMARRAEEARGVFDGLTE